MPVLKLLRFTTPDELRAAGGAWDDLWLRSGVFLPTVRAELVAQWVERFAPRARMHALAVEGDGRLLAALPLVGRRVKGVMPVAGLTGNAWSPNGDLLLDEQADAEAVLDLLAAGLDNVPWPLVWFDEVPFASPHWQALLAAVRRRGLTASERVDYQVGQVELPAEWDEYAARWSRNHRQKMRKVLNRLERECSAQYLRFVDIQPDQVDALLRRAFEVEDRSWKGANGTSVLRMPGISEFYCRQARYLAAYGELEVEFLQLAGADIAFHFGFRAKGTLVAFKVGYDERCAAFSPGLAMMHYVLQSLAADGQPAVLDYCGPLQDWTRKWSTRSYPVGRVVIAPRRTLSRTLFWAYERLRRGEPREPQPEARERATEAAAISNCKLAIEEHGGEAIFRQFEI